MKHLFHIAGVFLAAVFVGKCHIGCMPVQTPPEVEAAYTEDLLQCVKDHPQDKPAQDLCRVAVNYKWGLCSPTEAYPELKLCGK